MLAIFPVLLTLHTLTSMLFIMAYGTFIAITMWLSKETNVDHLAALIQISSVAMTISLGAFFVMGLTGLGMPFLLNIWHKGWVQLSVILMAVVLAHMLFMNEGSYMTLRRLVGLPYRQGFKRFPAEEPANPLEVVAQLKRLNVNALVMIGGLVPLLVLLLMLLKPF